MTRSSPSISWRRTSTISVSLVCTVAADEGGFDGKLAVPAVDQDAEANAFRAAQVEQAVHRGANRAAGVEHVVDDDQIAVIDREGDFCATAATAAGRWSRDRRDRA